MVNMAYQEQRLVGALLADMIETADPYLVVGLLVSAVPDRFDHELIACLQQALGQTDKRTFEVICSLPFVEKLPDGRWSVTNPQRTILRKLFIELNRDGFIATQQQAATYWEQDHLKAAGRYEIAQQRMGHSLLAGASVEEPTQVNGLSLMIGRFRELSDRHELAGLEELLSYLDSLRPLLVLLNASWLQTFDDLAALMLARLAQLRGDTVTSAQVLAPIMSRRDILPAHAPYLLRTHGDNLVENGKFVEAIELFTEALTRLDQEIRQRKVTNPDGGEWEILEAERGSLMLALGEAHFRLALAARGEKLSREPRTTVDQWRSWTYALLSLPLILYLTFFFGRWVWRSDFWVAVGTEDWFIIKLFAKAHAWTNRAKPVLQNYGSERENLLVADQQGRIYLELGAWSLAQKQFEQLRENGSHVLGGYQQGHISLNLAQATGKLGNTGQAFILTEEAVACFSRFNDTENLAKAQGLLAITLGEMRNYPDALVAYNQSFRNFETVEDWVSATGFAEYLEERVLLDPAFPPDLKERAFRLSDSLLRREYPVQFVHSGLKRLRLAAMASFALMVLAIPLLVLTTTETAAIVPVTDFVPPPLLDLDQPLAVDMSQSLLNTAGVRTVLLADATVLARSAVFATLIYLMVLITIGFTFIATIPIDTIEVQTLNERISLDHSGIYVGNELAQTDIGWGEMTCLIRANLAFMQRTPLYSSSLGIQTNRVSLTVQGQTAWFMPLRRRIEWQAVDANVRYLDYTIGRSVMLVLYVVGLFITLGFLLAGWLPGGRLWQPIGNTVYRPADWFTAVMLLLFLPPVWWAIVVRWRHKQILQPRAYLPWSLLFGGGALTILQLSTRFRPLLTVPDIFLPLLTIIMLIGGGFFIWKAQEMGGRVYRRALRYPLLLLTIVLSLINVGRIGRDVAGWHTLIMAHAYTASAQSSPNQAVARSLYKQAWGHYDLARQIQNWPHTWVAEEEAQQMPVGLPQRATLVSVQAMLGEGAVAARLGEYEVAIVEFKRAGQVLVQPVQQGRLNAWIGISRQSQRPRSTDRFALISENYQRALEDYNRAQQLDPTGTHYLLNQALVHHTLGNFGEAQVDYQLALDQTGGRPLTLKERAQAYIGLGWVLFEQQNYGGALLQFEQGILAAQQVKAADHANRELADAELGFGYAAYQLKQYDLAERSFVVAARMLPDDAIPLVALGATNLRLGTFAHDVTQGKDVCTLGQDVTPQVKTEAQERYVRAIGFLTRAAEQPNLTATQTAQLFRTRAEAHFLLQNCPDMVAQNQLEAGEQSLTKALELAPEDTQLWQLRGRFGMARWLAGQQSVELEPVLYRSLADIKQAMVLAPDSGVNQEWYAVISEQVAAILGDSAVQQWEAAFEQNGLNGRTPADFTGCYAVQVLAQNASTNAPQPNQLFRVTWDVRNRGACNWDGDVRLKFVGGEQLGVSELQSLPDTQPGERAQLVVSFVAPAEPAIYQSEWLFVDADGEAISAVQSVMIDVR